MAAKLAIIILATILVHHHQTSTAANLVKTEVFRSPEIVVEPGLVSNKNYLNIDFPRGHIGLKSFNAELVDESGNPVPLHEIYLHHWVLSRYFARKNNADDLIIVRNSGICGNALPQYFGVGAETRRTATDIPDPYGIQVGDPATIPAGYEEGWVLNVHAIDTRGAEDKMGCTECRCDLYGVAAATGDEATGGLRCCPDESRCRLKQGFHGENRSIYLQYTVKYVDWDSSSVVPLKIYILDVTDVWDQSKGIKDSHHCAVEYGVESCGVGVEKHDCVDTRSVSFSFPSGGDVIYGVGHQHAGGAGTTLYGEGGREICSSNPIYGEGTEAGNEAGFIVGMSTCYPSPAGPVRISAGETLTFVSNYSSVERHTGVMALFYLLLDDSSIKPLPTLVATIDYLGGRAEAASKIATVPKFVWSVALSGVVVVVIVVVLLKSKIGKADGYEAIL